MIRNAGIDTKKISKLEIMWLLPLLLFTFSTTLVFWEKLTENTKKHGIAVHIFLFASVSYMTAQ